MSDVNPIIPEFGELGDKTAMGPIKQIQEPDHSTAFKEELEKQARKVNEKNKEDPTQQENQAKRELIQKKPLISEWVATQPENLTSVFDVEKTKNKKPINLKEQPTEVLSAKTPLLEETPDSSNVHLSSQDDSLIDSLPEGPKVLEKERIPLEKSAEKTPLPAPLLQTKEAEQKPLMGTDEKPIPTIKTTESSFEQQPQDNPNPNKRQEVLISGKQPPTIEEKRIEEPLVKVSLSPTEHKDSKTLIEPPLIVSPKEPEKIVLEPKKALESISPPPVNLLTEDRKPLEIRSIPSPETPLLETPVTTSPPLQTETIQTPFIEKIDPSKTPLFSGPLPIESRKKDESISVTEEKESADEKNRIIAPSESGSLEKEKKDNEEEKGSSFSEEESKLTTPYLSASNTSAPVFMEGPAAPPQVISGFDNLHPEILNLFDRLLGIITVIQMQGKTETTFTLNENQFPSLKNTEVTLTTYDTAPLSYNIELTGTPEAAYLLQRNVEQLQKSFKDPKKEFNFQINDIRVSLQSEKKLEQEKNKKN